MNLREPYYIPAIYLGGLAGSPDRGGLRNSSSNQSFVEVSNYALDIGLTVAPELPTKRGSWRIWRNESLDVSSIAMLPRAGVDVAVYDPKEGLKARNLIVGISGSGFSTEAGFKQVLSAVSEHLIERPGYRHLPRGSSDQVVGFLGGATVGLVAGVEAGPMAVSGAEIQGQIVGGVLGGMLGGMAGQILAEFNEKRLAKKIPHASEYRANDAAFYNLMNLRNRLVEGITFNEVLDKLGVQKGGVLDGEFFEVYSKEPTIKELAARRIMERRQERDPDRGPARMEIYAIDRMAKIMEVRINQYDKVREITESINKQVKAIASGSQS